MLYAILCYASEDVVCSWSKEQTMTLAKLSSCRKNMPRPAGWPRGAAAAHDRSDNTEEGQGEAVVIDSQSPRPRNSSSASIARCADLDEAVDFARGTEVKPRRWLLRNTAGFPAHPRQGFRMTELAISSRSAPRAHKRWGPLRYFRDLDTAEEAFQDACLRALKNWPQNGLHR
jgi:hypothetical protein